MFIVTFLFTCQFLFSQIDIYIERICINEFMASNDSTISDPDGEFDDWIELALASDDTVNLYGWFISDKESNLTKHQFTDSLYIYPDSLLLLWADEDEDQGPEHLSFKLSAGGEEIMLTNPANILIDSVYFDQQQTDVSFGRYPNYTGNWGEMSYPTPGELNSTHDSSQYSQEAVVFPEPGIYSSPLYITLYAGQGEIDIFYSLDGSIPNTGSSQYSEPLLLTETTVIRVIAIEPGFWPSHIQTYNFILNSDYQLPVMALTIDPSEFPIGLNEYDVHVSYFDENGSLGFSSNAGIERQGSSSPQNPYQISFKTEYGSSYVDYPIFDNRSYQQFKRLILRNASNDRFPNSINNNNRAHLRDGIIHTIYEKLYPHGGYSSFQSLHVYINNAYWGIYHLRERQDKHYVEELFGYEEIDLLERTFGYDGTKNALEGDWVAYNALEDFVENQDMTLEENFQYLKDNIYYNEFLDYWILEVFVGNFDWLCNNMKYFRPQSGEDKWRWLLWDVDHGLGMDHNEGGVSWGDPETDYLDWSTGFDGPRVWNGNNNRIIRAIIRNDQGRLDFINRFADLLNTAFLNENIFGVIDSLENILSLDMEFHADRWGGNMNNWFTGVQNVKNYIIERQSHITSHIKNKFDLDTTFQVTLEIEPYYSGSIQINSISLSNFPWTGTYFSNVPITITANPSPGFEILQWDGTNIVANTIVLDSLEHDTTFTVILAPVSNHSLVINEFLARNNGSCFDNYGEADDFIELYNGTDTTVILNGMMITDDPTGSSNIFTISDTSLVSLLPGEFKVFWADNDTAQGFDHLNFQLDGDGEQIYLFNDSGTSVLDTIHFDEQAIDISFGRYSDGSFTWTEMYPTPGTENIGIGPVVNVSIDSVYFPMIHPYDTAKVSIELNNVGLADLVISELFITDQSVYPNFQIPLTLEPGTSDSLSFLFIPRNEGHLNAHAFLETNDPNHTNLDIYFQGTSELASHAILYEIIDVSEDEGFNVELGFIRSKFDGTDTSDTIDQYVIWQYNTTTTIWDSVNYISANEDSVYTIEISTLCNTTSDSVCLTTCRISTRLLNSDSLVWSNSLAGSSIDNLPPSIPSGLIAEFDDGIRLTWNSNPEEDLADYILDKSEDSSFYTNQYSSFLTSDTLFLDFQTSTDDTMFYRLSAIDNSGNVSGYSDTITYIMVLANDENLLIPTEFSLHQNYPNPFNPTTQIKYDLPEDALVTINIYDLMGRIVKNLVNGQKNAGYNSIQWNATNDKGAPVSAGLYLCTIHAGEFRQTKKMVLLK